MPATLRRQPKADTIRARPRASEPRSLGGREADRGQYKRGDPMEGKPAGVGGDFNPEFRGGANAEIGRGRGFGAPPS